MTEVDADRAAAYELAYREAIRALDDQRGLVDAFRTQAGLILSAAAITTSFLGGAALDEGGSAFTWLALAAFALISVSVLLMLWPSADWSVTARPRWVIRTYLDPDPLRLPLIHRDLVAHMDTTFLRNRCRLTRLAQGIRTSSVALGVETVAWLAHLIAVG